MDAALQSEVSLTGLITPSVPLLFCFFPLDALTCVASSCGGDEGLHLQPDEVVFHLLTCEGNAGWIYILVL